MSYKTSKELIKDLKASDLREYDTFSKFANNILCLSPDLLPLFIDYIFVNCPKILEEEPFAGKYFEMLNELFGRHMQSNDDDDTKKMKIIADKMSKNIKTILSKMNYIVPENWKYALHKFHCQDITKLTNKEGDHTHSQKTLYMIYNIYISLGNYKYIDNFAPVDKRNFIHYCTCIDEKFEELDRLMMHFIFNNDMNDSDYSNLIMTKPMTYEYLIDTKFANDNEKRYNIFKEAISTNKISVTKHNKILFKRYLETYNHPREFIDKYIKMEKNDNFGLHSDYLMCDLCNGGIADELEEYAIQYKNLILDDELAKVKVVIADFEEKVD